MAMPFLYRTCQGYVEIHIGGPGALAMLQAAAEQGMPAWRLRRAGEGYRANVIAAHFRLLRPLARQHGARVRIISRRGLPFMLRQPLRDTALAGLVVFVGVLYILGAFVWRVEVHGLTETRHEVVEQALREAGLRPGVLRQRVDIPAVEAHLLRAVSSISWAGIELRGSLASVRVVEKESSGDILDGMIPADLVAAKAGRIVTLIVLAGQPRVREGDVVAAGQVLISGDPPALEFHGRTKPPPGWPPAAIRARGHVRAAVSYEVRVEVPWTLAYERRTGRSWQRSLLRIGVRELTLTGGEGPPFELWQEERQTIAWPALAGQKLAELCSVTYYEVERITEDLGPGGARLEAEAIARRDFGLMLPPGALVVSQALAAEELTHATAVRLVVEVIEDIARVRLRGGSHP
jgi:similar to stage IV sporulation protein